VKTELRQPRRTSRKTKPNEPRYVVVDEDGDILDDAQGYGYRDALGAEMAWRWKCERNQGRQDNSPISEIVQATQDTEFS
jgi:hypothetical protein